MENNNSRLFYMGIAYGAYPEPGERLTKTGLPIKKLEREFPYLLGTGEAAGSTVGRTAGRLEIYHTLLPEYCGKTFFTGKPKNWKKEMAGRLLEEAGKRAMAGWDCRDQLRAPEFGGKTEEIPQELWAVCLYQCRPFDRIYITLEEEDGEYGLRQAVQLLLPYLPRLRLVIYVGEENGVSLMLESWLYGEFGIVMLRAGTSSPNWPWLDLRGGIQEGEEPISVSETALPGDMLLKAASCGSDNAIVAAGRPVRVSGPRHINRRETLKFLDTAVKNGYNTKVN